jgi:uncharacterized protein YjbI with pentapeptide repeats
MPVVSSKTLVQTRLSQADVDAICAKHDRLWSAKPGGARAVFAFKDLTGADLRNRNLCDADFTGAILADCNFRGARLDNATMFCADLTGASLTEASMRRTDLRGSCMRNADLTGADLFEADCSRPTCARAPWPRPTGSWGTSAWRPARPARGNCRARSWPAPTWSARGCRAPWRCGPTSPTR